MSPRLNIQGEEDITGVLVTLFLCSGYQDVSILNLLQLDIYGLYAFLLYANFYKI